MTSIKILLVISVAVLGNTNCGRTSGLKTQICSFFKDYTIGIASIRSKLSESDISAITFDDTFNQVRKIKSFFNELQQDRNYNCHYTDTLIYITFNQNYREVGGPTIALRKGSNLENWFITDIRFGK